MEEFAALLDALVYTRSRNAKLKLLADYLARTPDPDRGWALAALTDGLDFPAVKSSTIRNLLNERIDPILWTLSRDYVGDSAETASLLWPEPEAPPSPPTVAEAVDALARSLAGEIAAALGPETDPRPPATAHDALDAHWRAIGAAFDAPAHSDRRTTAGPP